MGLGHTTKKTEGGSGGKRGHSNMAHREHTEDIKMSTRKLRRVMGKREIANLVQEHNLGE